MSQKLKTTPKPSPKNTLFNYFSKNASKTPKTDEKQGESEKEENAKVLSGKQLDFGKLFSIQAVSMTDKIIACRKTLTGSRFKR